MAPCLSKFPSVCLETIFKHLPLVDLFNSVGLVCISWYMSRRTELARRRRLGLFYSDTNESINEYRVLRCSYGSQLIERVLRDDGSPWHLLEPIEVIKYNCLPVRRGIPRFTSLLCNITRLHLNLVCTGSDVAQLIRLLDQLSECLLELHLNISFTLNRFNEDDDYEDDDDDYDDDEDNDRATREHALSVDNLMGALNRLRSVRQLSLDLANLGTTVPPLLSCLSRLETVAVRLYDANRNAWILASIGQHGQNVPSIAIYNAVNIRAMLQLEAQLVNKFTLLSVKYGRNDDDDGFDDIADNMPAMRQFCDRFISLTHLKLHHSNRWIAALTMTNLAQCLSSLDQLVHLQLTFDFNLPPIEDDEEDAQGAGQQQITQIPSVRMLSIFLHRTESHHDTERLLVADIFPNVQVLRFENNSKWCTDCGISVFDAFDEQLAARYDECERLTRQPFRRCVHLHTFALVVFGKETLINLDEL